jgi:hypothetical protein
MEPAGLGDERTRVFRLHFGLSKENQILSITILPHGH